MLNRQKRKQSHPMSKLVTTFGWDAQAAVPGLKINPYETLGESGHKVMSGVMYGEAEMDVVIKPHSKVDRATREQSIARSIAKAGLNTPEPLGVYHGERATYLVARRYHGLKTLTDISLEKSIAHPSVTKLILPRLERAGVAMANLHNNRFVHLDYQARNTGEGPNAEPVYFDFERTQYNSTAVNETTRAEDLYKLAGSVLMLGYLGEKKPAYRVAAMDEAIRNVHEAHSSFETDYDMYEAAVHIVAQTGDMSSSIRVATN